MFKKDVDDYLSLILVERSMSRILMNIVNENFAYLSKWLGWTLFTKTKKNQNEFITKYLHEYADGKSIIHAIEYNNEIVDVCGFNKIYKQLLTTEIGYWLSDNMQGKGIATRVCKFLINYAFDSLEMSKVEIWGASENFPSRAVCERFGMKLEGVISNRDKIEDIIVDHFKCGKKRP